MKMQNNEWLITVVVPIYNVENYLECCIESILSQSYTNLEIILVDDGSTDSSGKICDVYANRDKRIRVVHKKNGGLSDARNRGLRKARGKYITFIDADDMVGEHFVESLFEAAKINESDISICDYTFIEDNIKKVKEMTCGDVYLLSNIQCEKEMYCHSKHALEFVAWGKLYKTQLFFENNIEYPEGKIHEDLFTTYKLIYFSQKISVIGDVLYFYRKRTGSIMNKGFNLKTLDKVEANHEACDFFKNTDVLPDALNYHLRIIILFRYLISKSDNITEKKYYLDKLKEIYRSDWIKYKGNFKYSIKNKVAYQLYFYFPIRIFGKIFE